MSAASYHRPKMAYHWPKTARSNGGSSDPGYNSEDEFGKWSIWSHVNQSHLRRCQRGQKNHTPSQPPSGSSHIEGNDEKDRKRLNRLVKSRPIYAGSLRASMLPVKSMLALIMLASALQLSSCNEQQKTSTEIQRVTTPAPKTTPTSDQPLQLPALTVKSQNNTSTNDTRQAASTSQVFYDDGTGSGDVPVSTTALELRTPPIDSVGESISDQMATAASKKKKKKMMKKSKKMEKKHKEWKKGKKHKKKKYESKKKKGGSEKKKKGKKEKKKWGMEKKGHKKKGNFKKKKWGSKKKMKKGHKKGKKGHKMLKDKGHKKKGFKKIYHKEEWGKKKKWHDIKREKKWNTKQKKWKKKWHQEKGKKYKGKHMKKYHKKNKHGKKYKKEKKSKWKKHKGEKFKKGHKKKKEEYSKKKEGGKKKKMKKMKKEMKKKKKG